MNSCRSEDGVTVGLVDSIIAIARVLAPRLREGKWDSEVVGAQNPVHPPKHVTEAPVRSHGGRGPSIRADADGSRLRGP